LAPDIYYAVVPIIKQGNKIRLSARAGKYEILDYAIKMKELPQETIMTDRLKKRTVNYSMVGEIARIIANFHNHSKSRLDLNKFGNPEIIKYNWDENFAQTEPFIGITINKNIFTAIKNNIEKFSAEQESVFLKRISDQKIKQCHGDLHSQNIFIADKVYIFDCLEFNPRFAVSDVASEIAFFVMDLEYFGYKHLADFFIARYLHYTNDWKLLKVLDFYKCYRAYVRGKVTGFNLNDRGMSKSDKEEAKYNAKKYFALSYKYSLNLKSRPKLIMVMGFPGVGKTYLAERLAEHISAYHLCSDIIRKEITNTPIEEHRFDGYGNGIYKREVSGQTFEELYRRTDNYLSQSKTCIIDATFSWAKARDEVHHIAEKNRAEFYIINCTCPEKTVLKRMKKREKEFSLSDATPEIYYRIKDTFEQVKNKKNYIKIDTSKHLKNNLRRIARLISKSNLSQRK
jgi:aminoglycoside phosphotransferase family enzyme/predicted kinase